MDYLDQEKIRLATYSTKGLKKFDWLIPAKVIKDSRHVYYFYPFRFLLEKIGIKKSTFAKALRTEGFPVNENHGILLYLFPLYQKKQCYPNSHFPFVSKEYPHPRSIKGVETIARRWGTVVTKKLVEAFELVRKIN